MARSYYWLTLCIVIWGSSFVIGKILVEHFSPSMITMLRLLAIVLFLSVLAIFNRQRKRITKKRDIALLIVLGVVGVFINQWTFFAGLETADPTSAALILALTPIITGFLAAIFLKEQISLRMVIGSLIAIVGIFYVVTNGDLTSVQIDKGLLWIVVTMLTFAIMIIITRFLGERVDAFSITFYSNIIGFVIAIPFAFLLDKPIVVSTSLNPWLLLIGTAIIVHGVATLIWNNHIRNVDAAKASVLSNLEPFVAMVTGLIILAKPITLIEIIGSLFIVTGVVLSTYEKRVSKT